MLQFVPSEKNPDYGLGIHQEFNNGKEELGHTAGGIGAGCILGYYPSNNTYNFLAINLGVSITPQIAEPFEEELNTVYEILSE